MVYYLSALTKAEIQYRDMFSKLSSFNIKSAFWQFGL